MKADGVSVGDRGGELGGDGMSEQVGFGAVRERVSMLRGTLPALGSTQVAKF
jgi:hypothetical protein